MQHRFIAHREVAKELLALSGELLHIKELRSYIVLERKVGKSDVNKNAVSLLQEGVLFMLSDWAFEHEARALELSTERSKSFPRLLFPSLTLQEIQRYPDYFARLTREATREAERLQTSGAGH